MQSEIPTVKLKGSGDELPVIGFGAGTKWRIAKASGETKDQYIEELAQQVANAISAGFNHIDAAEAYKTHQEVGAGIKNSDTPRDKIFLTDKYTPWSWAWRKGTGPLESLTLSLEKMNLSYVDLYLLHVPNITPESAGIDLKEAWRQMEEILDRKMAKNIGVSNFDVESLEYIQKVGKYQPVVNQIEFNAYMQQQSPGILKYCRENDIVIEGYSPLAPLTKGRPGPLDDILPGIVNKYKKSELQILLRWVIQNGVVAVTTSGKQERLMESLDIFDFQLSDEDFKLITETGKGKLFRGFIGDRYDKFNDVLYEDL
ncbi:LANO_0D00650g1_1 [Lachancea nothofagi CBS 11611]|uniref:LANO_0D00650g1_1 n=1 Tax=Lachancea nothofagi CBS 11611 TaxID=1266666 RepID=A0A1G4JD46_9SACH|nr:LANO_0D00650g1_1 [Lachancea nothofagi CBS 11611]